MASTVTGLPQARASCLRMGVSRIQMGCTEGGVSVSAIITLLKFAFAKKQVAGWFVSLYQLFFNFSENNRNVPKT